MGTIKRLYGHFGTKILEDLGAAGLLKVEAFIAFLAERGIEIDRTLISHWRAGRSHLPADLLPLLSEFSERPDLVFGPMLRALHCDVAHIPEGAASDRQLIDLVLEAGAALGRLQLALFEARMPGSPGGEAITEAERQELEEHLDRLIQRLADLKARLVTTVTE